MPPTQPSDYKNPPHLSSETLPLSSSLATFSPNIASPPLTFSSSEGFVFPFSSPSTTEKATLKRSISNPDLQKFPSFLSQLAYFSSLPPLIPPPSTNPKIPSNPPIPTSNSFDILVTKDALQSEGHQNL